jgi:hypothetical protein
VCPDSRATRACCCWRGVEARGARTASRALLPHSIHRSHRTVPRTRRICAAAARRFTMPAAVRRRAGASAAASGSQDAEGSHSAQGVESSRDGAAAPVPDAQLCRLASIELSGTPSVMGSCVALSPAGQAAFVSPAAIHVLVRRSDGLLLRGGTDFVLHRRLHGRLHLCPIPVHRAAETSACAYSLAWRCRHWSAARHCRVRRTRPFESILCSRQPGTTTAQAERSAKVSLSLRDCEAELTARA